MGVFLAGFGITLVAFWLFFAGIVACAHVIAVIRAALNSELGTAGTVGWILACLFIPGAGLVYFAFVDKNALLKLVGWVCIAAFIIGGVLGGAALREIVHGGGDHMKAAEQQFTTYSETCVQLPGEDKPTCTHTGQKTDIAPPEIDRGQEKSRESDKTPVETQTDL